VKRREERAKFGMLQLIVSSSCGLGKSHTRSDFPLPHRLWYCMCTEGPDVRFWVPRYFFVKVVSLLLAQSRIMPYILQP